MSSNTDHGNNNNNGEIHSVSSDQNSLVTFNSYSSEQQVLDSDGITVNEPNGFTNESSAATRRLSRHSTSTPAHLNSSRFNEAEIYPNMDENSISLKRVQTRATIIEALEKRVESTSQKNEDIIRTMSHMRNYEASDLERNATSDTDSQERSDNEKENERFSRSSNAEEEDEFGEVPEILSPAKDYGDEFASIDPELVTWDGHDDPEFPRNWRKKDKYVTTALISIYTFLSPMSSSMLSPGMDKISEDFGITSAVVKSLVISIFILAWAIFPLFSAPISEMYGRKIVLNVSIWLMLAFNLGCAFAQNTGQMLVFRFLAGCAGASPLNVGPGVIGDLYNKDERATFLSFYALGPTLGPVFAPVIAGFIIEKQNWRWIFRVLCIVNGVTAILGTIFYRETFSPTLLRAKARRLRKETGNPNLTTIFDIADGETVFGKFYVNITRPMKLLVTNPMVIGLGSFMAFVYGFMYLMIVTFPAVWGGIYGFRPDIVGLLYIPMGIGFFIGIIFWTILINKDFRRLESENNGVAKPEFRLPCLIHAGYGCPMSLILFGFTAQYHVHWAVPAVATGLFAFFLIDVFQTIQNYLIDMNPRFAASSAAAAATFRSIFGFVFPLFAPSMYSAMKYSWGNLMFGCIGFLLGIPFPLFVLKYGERLRLWANARLEVEQAKRDAKNLARLKKINDNKINSLKKNSKQS
ncbi:hypothetical protein B5S33_g5432 [[Candida] boidinii]|nr:hypothetical protein B5S30_g5115 [[Candida] boidinii]OWB86721.1 hypothetical protein B5S33_g5432 [[Candida] boidinii]GMF98973.1 unnamed protein product [[Candida] boidinii]